MVALMGRAPDAPPPRVDDFLDCLHPDDRERMAELGQRQVVTGRGEEAFYRVVRADGSVRHVRALTAVRTAADGTVTHLWGTAVDVTDQVESAARVEASEEHFRVAFDNAPTGMSMISLATESMGRYLRANDAFLEMVGCSRDELVGTPLLHLTHPADRDLDAQRFGQLVSGEADQLAFEKRYLRRDGTAIHSWVRTSVARGHRGEPLFLITHAQDITEQLAEQAELERLALTDNLTGLANRTLLTDRMDQALARLQRTGGSVAMLLLDVDRFKLVNDSLGHQVGDALLVEMAGRIEAVSRADATVARLGGDEFVVLVEGLREPQEIHGVATRLIETLRRPYNLGPHAESLVATVSVGVSVATSSASSHVDLYREADLALYRAKDSGRDQYALFDDALRARAVGRMRAETVLRQAIAQDQLVAVFQPMVDLTDGTVRAAEGLVRILDRDGGLIPPAEFIDVAEETGMIVEVDARMFEMVAKEYARVAALPDVPLRRLSTNVSARSLEDPGFVDRVRRALTWYRVPGSAIRVELTERSLLTSSPAVRESLERLAALGLQVGLDDFGTGYSALAYLQRFTLTFLKIDRSFVSRLGMSARDDAVVAAVVDLAHAHDLVVIAEGVETPEQLAALREMGCDRAQGYLIGRPMASADLEELLRSDPRW
ncbi:MAG TPA: EAL domain-containing protein, partial [Actinomycetes bacterium]|nr:EAL domain-containing protein [Actinomycetes bacterium]